MNERLWKVTTTVTDFWNDSGKTLTIDIASPGATRGKARSNAVAFLKSEYDSDIEFTHPMSIKRTNFTARRNCATWWEECPICNTPFESEACRHTTDEMLSAWEAQAHIEIEAIFGSAGKRSALDMVCYNTSPDGLDDRTWAIGMGGR